LLNIREERDVGATDQIEEPAIAPQT